MQIILSEKMTGKTSMLIALSAQSGAVIVCVDQAAVRNTERMAKKFGKIILQPITYTSVQSGALEGSKIPGLLMDDADRFLVGLCGNIPLQVIAMTKEEETQ